MKQKIKCRFFIKTDDGYDQVVQFSNEFADECAKRIGDSINAESVQRLHSAVFAVLE